MLLILLLFICFQAYGAEDLPEEDRAILKVIYDLHVMTFDQITLDHREWELAHASLALQQCGLSLAAKFLSLFDQENVFEIRDCYKLMKFTEPIRTTLAQACKKEEWKQHPPLYHNSDLPPQKKQTHDHLTIPPLNIDTFLLAFSALQAHHDLSQVYEEYQAKYISLYRENVNIAKFCDKRYIDLYHALLLSLKCFCEGNKVKSRAAYHVWNIEMHKLSDTRRSVTLL
ncbi:MAG: hypothetical protein OXC30_04660 [Alphaproteobacteria bacterium]|nr:hypothetical protein [Alphaproteobacteria bacterium]